MSDIALNISSLKKEIPQSVKVVAVSKTKPASDIIEAYNTGHRIFGENRVQELVTKKDLLPSDIEWHMIGHLQTNKVKLIIPFVKLIHSIDSYHLLNVVNQEAMKINKVVDCLLQFHIAMEETKSGFSISEAEDMISADSFRLLRNVRVCGVMGMATFTDNHQLVRKEFRQLKDFFMMLKARYFPGDPYFRELSMGMSGDYRIAIEEGSTMVRVGSIIFGSRK